MRIVIDLRVDDDGRPVGTIRMLERLFEERFADWLDLLRVLETCVHQVYGESSP